MKTSTTLLTGLLFLLSPPVQAQEEKGTLVPDTVQVEELKARFDDWIAGRPQTYSAHQVMGRGLVYEWDADGVRLLFDLTSRHPERLWVGGKDSIPPGRWQTGTFPDDNSVGLYWHGVAYPAQGTDTTALQRKMEKRYGKVPGLGIPARWVNDTVCFTAHSQLYCNNRICNYSKVREVKKGVITNGAELHTKHGSLSEEHSFCNQTITIGAYQYSQHYGKVELYLLRRDLGAMPLPESYKGKTNFSFLVYVSPDGKAGLHTLLPKQLTGEEQELINALKTAFDRLPKGIFGHMVTTDGRIFPARYLEGYYVPKTRKWMFTDYLFDKRNQTDNKKI